LQSSLADLLNVVLVTEAAYSRGEFTQEVRISRHLHVVQVVGSIGGAWAGIRAGGAIAGPIGATVGGILGLVAAALLGGWLSGKVLHVAKS